MLFLFFSSFIQLIGELSELQDKDYRDSERQATSRPNSAASSRHDSDQLGKLRN
jgi:hypothetical protein